MSSYLNGTTPSRTTGSYGIVKATAEAISSRLRRVWPDEWNRIIDDLINIWKTVGIAGSTDPNSHEHRLDDADTRFTADEGRLDALESPKARLLEHFVVTTPHIDDVGAVSVVEPGGPLAIGVRKITLAMGVATGFDQADDHWYQRGTKIAIRWLFDALPGTDGDTIEIGLVRDATHFITIASTRAAGVWPAWICKVKNGVAEDSDTLTAIPLAGTWARIDITTTPTGATFIYEKGGVAEETVAVAEVPEDACAHPSVLETSNVGGEDLLVDFVALEDTGTSGGPPS